MSALRALTYQESLEREREIARGRKEYFDTGRFIRNRLDPENREKIPEDAIINRVAAEVEKLEQFQMARGVYLPDSVLRDLTAGAATGTYLVAGTEITDWAATLRAASSVTLAGAVPYQAIGNFALPVITSGAVAYWPGEGGTVSETTPTIAQVTSAPKPVAASVDCSKLLLKISPVAEPALTSDLIGSLIEEIDRAALLGSGGAEPTGLKNWANVNAASGNAIDWGAVCDVVYTSEASKAPGPYSWIMHPLSAKLLRQRLKDAANTASGYLLGNDMLLAGHLVILTAAMPTDEAAFGPFGQMGIVRWGRTDLVVNPFSQGKGGVAELTAFIYCDVIVKRPATFTWISSIS